MDFPEIARTALLHSERICSELFPLGKKRGREFVVGDIYGNAGDSLSVNLSSGIWKDFSNGAEKGGDLTSLVAAAKSISQSEAAEFIESRYGTSNYTPATTRLQEEFEPIYPAIDPPDSAFSHSGYGEPTNIYAYYRQDKSLSNFICRFDIRGQKTFLPLSYGKISNAVGWHWKQLPAPRILYGLENLPELGQICIVEGEKAADAAAKLLSDMCVLTWPGGAQGISKIDWSPLFSKKYDVLLWPDNDEPGKEAMQKIAAILINEVASVSVLDVSLLAPKDDAADWNKTSEELQKFIAANSKPVVFPEPAKPKKHITSDGDINPLNIPGLIGDTVRWIVATADQPRPDIALLNTISFAGAVFGRRYESPRRTRSNIYMVATADTGAGKNHPRQMITKLAIAAGLSDYLGGNSIRSDTGMLRGLMNNGSQLLMLDEFGQFLRALHDPKMVHYRNIMRTFLTLYSDSNSIYNHGDYADPKAKTIKIHAPNLCIFGTTTESEYIPALRKSSIESGELNRFIVLPMDSGKMYPLRESPSQNIPESLLEGWQKFAPSKSDKIGIIVNNDTILPQPEMIEWGECDDAAYKLRCEQEDIRCSNLATKSLWGRLYENTIKIAMILSIGSTEGDAPIFLPESWAIAESIVRASVKYMESLAESHMAENEYEALVQEMHNFIKSGKGVDKTAITRRFQRIDSKKRDDILRTLVDQDAIIAVITMSESGAGRKKTIYQSVK